MIPLRRVVEEHRRLILPLAFVLVANVVLYGVAVYPLSRKVNGAEDRAALARNGRISAQREQAAVRGMLEGKDRADRELRRFYAEVLPPDQAAARRITYLRLDRLAREAGLEPGRMRFDPVEVKNSSLTELHTSLELQGNYSAIRRFVYLLETAPEFTIIQNVALASSREGQLDLKLELATYYRTPGHGE